MYFKTGGKLYLGIDIGGSSIKYGCGNSHHGLLFFRSKNLEEKNAKGIKTTLKNILKEAEETIKPNKLEGIGLGTPGMLNLKTGLIQGINPNLQDWTDLDPRISFDNKWHNRIWIDNDANLMTLAEASLRRKVKYVVGITIGSGIGSGLVINGKIYHGAHGYSMELGHNTVVINGALCNCGRKGCLEAYASVNGMINRIHEIKPNVKVMNIGQILSLASKNRAVGKILSDSLMYLGTAIANLAINLDADAIIIGGGVIEVPEYPFAKLKKSIKSNLPSLLSSQILITKAKLGNKSGVMGGILLAEQSDISE